MTCEICGKSQMDVATYQLPANILKFNACTMCCRDIDFMVHNSHEDWVKEIRSRIMKIIYARLAVEKEKR